LKDAFEYANDILENPRGAEGYYNDNNLVIFPYFDELEIHQSVIFGGSSGMFSNCKNLRYFQEGMKIIGTYLVGAFSRTSSLTYVDLSKLTVVGTSMGYMFADSGVVEVKANDDFTSKATDLSGLFQNCKNLVSAPVIDVSNCHSVRQLFSYCTALKSATIKGDISKITDYMQVFNECDSLTELKLPRRFKITNYGALGKSQIPKIYGSIIYTYYGSYSMYWLFSAGNNVTRYMVLEDIGIN
jgi:hypothetical protein